jgi:hypothetical protein
MKQEKQRQFTRRGFMQGAATAVIGVAATNLVACAAEPEPEVHTPVGLPETWDDEAEIVIVGFGGGGGIAAISAADAGCSDILLIEKYPNDTATEVNHTPSARMSMAATVVTNNAQEGSEHLYWLSRGKTTKDVCDAWGLGAMAVREFYNSIGGDDFFKEVTRWGAGEFPDGPGGGTIGMSIGPGGPKVFQAIRRNILVDRADKIRVRWATKGTRLIINEETKVICGVQVEDTATNEVLNIKAKKAVALCTGGFEHNDEMKRQNLPSYPFWFYTNPNNTGEGILMGQAVGAQVWHMTVASARAVPYHPDWPKACNINLNLPYIIVNKLGKRYFFERDWASHNAYLELVHFETFEEYATYLANPSWIIYDDTSRKPLISRMPKGILGDDPSLDDVVQYGPEDLEDVEAEVRNGWILRDNTLEGLAAQILADEENEGFMDIDTFVEQVRLWNEMCVEERDTQFHRQSGFTPLSQAPYYALKLYPGGPNTQGGLQKNGKGQIIDIWGNVIPRLYSAGENGSCYGFLYPVGGANVCEMAVFGQIIGKEMAALDNWDAEEEQQ